MILRMFRDYLAQCRRRVEALEADRVATLAECYGVETLRSAMLASAVEVARFRVALIESLGVRA